MATEHKIGAHLYRIGRLNAKDQLQIVRRIAPVFSDSAPMVMSVFRRIKAGERPTLDTLIEHFEPAVKAFKGMSDDDVDYVVDKALSVVDRQMKGAAGWGPMTAPNGVLMHQDLDWVVTVQLVWLVIQQNVLNFFDAAPSSLDMGAN